MLNTSLIVFYNANSYTGRLIEGFILIGQKLAFLINDNLKISSACSNPENPDMDEFENIIDLSSGISSDGT
jgi:hypothetical protein